MKKNGNIDAEFYDGFDMGINRTIETIKAYNIVESGKAK